MWENCSRAVTPAEAWESKEKKLVLDQNSHHQDAEAAERPSTVAATPADTAARAAGSEDQVA